MGGTRQLGTMDLADIDFSGADLERPFVRWDLKDYGVRWFRVRIRLKLNEVESIRK